MTRRRTEPAPLSTVLDPRVDEGRIRRVWRGVEPHVVGSVARRPRTAAPLGWRLVAMGGLVAIGVAVVVLARAPSAERPSSLALMSGAAPTAIAATEAQVVSFADGSRIELSAGAEIVPTLNDRDEFSLTIARGVVNVAVVPGGPRRWRFDCGLALVEVIGTELRMERGEEGVRVSVSHGHVRVTRRADGRVWDLLAGDAVLVEPPMEAAIAAEAPALPIPELAIATAVEPPRAAEPRVVPAHPQWAELAQSGEYVRAYDALDEEGGAHDEVLSAGSRELMLLADVARLSGHASEAVEPLERLLALHGQAPEAPLAAVVLGRVQQDALHAPAAAARALERAESLGVPASLAADVEGRLALAYLEVGDARGTERGRHYLAAHPEGAHAAALRARLD